MQTQSRRSNGPDAEEEGPRIKDEVEEKECVTNREAGD